MTPLSFLGLAVGYRKIGVVFIRHGRLKHWQIAKVAYLDLDKLSILVTTLIKVHRPSVVVIEDIEVNTRKGEGTRQRIAAIGTLAREHSVLVMRVARRQQFANKYEEARHLAERYRDLKPWVSEKVPIWQNEPRRMILFEALALADQAMRSSTEDLAAIMG